MEPEPQKTSQEREVMRFFESYRDAFGRKDAEAIADHFAYPAHVASDAGQVMLSPVSSRREWRSQVEQLLQMYQQIDFHVARVLAVSVKGLSTRLLQAAVRWALDDTHGKLLYDFEAIYTLGHFGNGWKIVAMSHNELPRFWACLEARHTPSTPR
jgi:hypothetical protein